MANKEQYSGGYSPLIINQFKLRSLRDQGTFLLPYLKAGLTVLDCGCGPGSMTLDIAQLVSPGHVSGIDSSPIQIEQAMLLQTERGIINCEFIAGSIYQIPYPDKTFDVVFAHAVLYHLHQPQDALLEFRRVLKPNGLVALRDACHTGDMMVPASLGLTAAWETIDKVFTYQRGDINFGSQHHQILLNTGFSNISVSCSYDMFSSIAEKDSIHSYWECFLGDDHRRLILEQGWCTETELAQQCNALKEWSVHPASFFARARCEAIGYK
jgi:ubiquinone/menaquinone biosynthesis C-methylase UbiE